MITLYPHQDLKFHEIRHHIDNGETDILFSSPMGSGKTRTLQYLIEDLKSSRMFNKYLVIVPFVSLKQSWLQLANLFSKSNDAEFEYNAKTLTVADVKNKSFWEDFTDETFIISRIAIGSKEIIDWLENEKPNCSGIFILCDEGHHHANVNLAGELCNVLWKLGATIIRATGTPWHNLTELRNKNTKPVTLSFAEYARQLDPKTKKSLAPVNWESRKVLVPFKTNDLAVAYDPRYAIEELMDAILEVYENKTLMLLSVNFSMSGIMQRINELDLIGRVKSRLFEIGVINIEMNGPDYRKLIKERKSDDDIWTL